jgi:hypothetical protein
MNGLNKDQLENMTVDELKSIIDDLAIVVPKGKKAKKYFVDIIEQHIQHIQHIHNKPNTISNSSFSFGNNTKDKEPRVKTQTLLLNHKRLSTNDNYQSTPISKKMSIHHHSDIIRNSTIPREFASSKSLQNLVHEIGISQRKSLTSIKQSAKVDNFAVSNYYNVNPFSEKPISRISTNLALIKKESNYKCFSSKPIELDNETKLQIIFSSIGLFSFACFLNGKSTLTDIYSLVNSFSIENNKNILLACSLIIAAYLGYMVYQYDKQRQEYKSLCINIAEQSFKDTIDFMQQEIEENNLCFIEEDKLISILSDNYGMKHDDYKQDVYNPYLTDLLKEVYSLEKKNLIEEGEIKSFWIAKS